MPSGGEWVICRANDGRFWPGDKLSKYTIMIDYRFATREAAQATINACGELLRTGFGEGV